MNKIEKLEKEFLELKDIVERLERIVSPCQVCGGDGEIYDEVDKETSECDYCHGTGINKYGLD